MRAAAPYAGESNAPNDGPIPYMSLAEAKRAVGTIPESKLAREVLKYADVPIHLTARFREQPLLLSRPIATPNEEMKRFLRLAASMGRPPLIITMPNDRFMPDMNPSKRRLAKLPIQTRENAFRYITVAPFNNCRGERLSDVMCFDHTPLPIFHLRLLEQLCGSAARSAVVDASSLWRGQRPAHTYPRLFSVLTCFGFLADSFDLKGLEAKFTDTIVRPSIEATIARFGVPPRLVRLLPCGQEYDPAWEHYSCDALPYAVAASRPLRVK